MNRSAAMPPTEHSCSCTACSPCAAALVALCTTSDASRSAMRLFPAISAAWATSPASRASVTLSMNSGKHWTLSAAAQAFPRKTKQLPVCTLRRSLERNCTSHPASQTCQYKLATTVFMVVLGRLQDTNRSPNWPGARTGRCGKAPSGCRVSAGWRGTGGSQRSSCAPRNSRTFWGIHAGFHSGLRVVSAKFCGLKSKS